MKGKNKAVFLDRDGTINEEVQYLSDLKKFRLLPKVAPAIKLLNDHGFKVIVITNQAGVARGYFGEDKVEEINEEMKRQLREKDAHLDGMYYCPHHPTEGMGKYKKDCWCRKPNPGMLKKAVKDFDLDLSKSYVIGDQLTDVKLGNNAGCQTVLVLTGYGKESYRKKGDCEVRVSFVADDLEKAVGWILEKEELGV
jgi:D-glycero-D-manno-heptose 1,7-bisphosphate phosphatase